MAFAAFLALIGLCSGILSGIVGIGGGVIIVPALVYLLGFSQQQAQGTALAILVPPIGILAAWTYYRHGYVDIKVAAFVALGFFFGGLLGSRIAVVLPTLALRRLFGALLMAIALTMIFRT